MNHREQSEQIKKLKGKNRRHRLRIAELELAIRWALGEHGEFPLRQEHQGQYYWRTHLRHIAKLEYKP